MRRQYDVEAGRGGGGADGVGTPWAEAARSKATPVDCGARSGRNCLQMLSVSSEAASPPGTSSRARGPVRCLILHRGAIQLASQNSSKALRHPNCEAGGGLPGRPVGSPCTSLLRTNWDRSHRFHADDRAAGEGGGVAVAVFVPRASRMNFGRYFRFVGRRRVPSAPPMDSVHHASGQLEQPWVRQRRVQHRQLRSPRRCG